MTRDSSKSHFYKISKHLMDKPSYFAAENEKWLRVRIFKNIWLRMRFRQKTQNPAGVHSEYVITSDEH